MKKEKFQIIHTDSMGVEIVIATFLGKGDANLCSHALNNAVSDDIKNEHKYTVKTI